MVPKRRRKKYSGLTLIEVVVAMFVFVLLMAAVSQIFSSAFFGYRDTRAVQRDLENAQFAMNKIAKALRTSTVVSNAGIQSYVRFYDYSQGTCFRFQINNNNLEVASKAIAQVPNDPLAAVNECQTTSLGSYSSVTTGNVGGRFYVTPSAPTTRVGKVTIELEINQGPKHTATIQTTVSLRDYGYVGLLNL